MKAKNSLRVCAEQERHSSPVSVHTDQGLHLQGELESRVWAFDNPLPSHWWIKLTIEPSGAILIPTKAKIDLSLLPADNQGPHTEGRTSQLNLWILSVYISASVTVCFYLFRPQVALSPELSTRYPGNYYASLETQICQTTGQDFYSYWSTAQTGHKTDL